MLEAFFDVNIDMLKDKKTIYFEIKDVNYIEILKNKKLTKMYKSYNFV